MKTGTVLTGIIGPEQKKAKYNSYETYRYRDVTYTDDTGEERYARFFIQQLRLLDYWGLGTGDEVLMMKTNEDSKGFSVWYPVDDI